MMLWKCCCTQYANTFGKLSSGCKTGKGQFSFQSQRKAMPKNVQTMTQLHSSHMRGSNAQDCQRQASTVHEPWISNVQVGFRKGRGTSDQIANICWNIKRAREFQKNIYFYFIDYANTFDCVDHKKLWKILKETGIPDHLTHLLRNLSGSNS